MRIRSNNIDKLSTFERGNMSDFNDRGFKIYRSNVKQTTKYFTGWHYGKEETEECFFELVTFNYKYGKAQMFLQYPYTDFYVELTTSGVSSRGGMIKQGMNNPIGDIIDGFYYEGKLVPEKFTLYGCDDNLMVDFDHDHVFFELVAELEWSIHGRMADVITKGETPIKEMLAKQYVKIPDLRKVVYSYHNNDDIIIVDQSAYNFTYEGMRCWYRKGTSDFQLVNMEDFQRYRDGGTTTFTFKDNEGIKHEFYSPSSFKNDVSATLDKTQLTELPKDCVNTSVEQLGIKLEPLYESN